MAKEIEATFCKMTMKCFAILTVEFQNFSFIFLEHANGLAHVMLTWNFNMMEMVAGFSNSNKA